MCPISTLFQFDRLGLPGADSGPVRTDGQSKGGRFFPLSGLNIEPDDFAVFKRTAIRVHDIFSRHLFPFLVSDQLDMTVFAAGLHLH